MGGQGQARSCWSSWDRTILKGAGRPGSSPGLWAFWAQHSFVTVAATQDLPGRRCRDSGPL